ncbi:hypothetical protein RFI_21566, partial [Reticulomyxa filosa]
MSNFKTGGRQTETLGHIIEKLPPSLFQPETGYNPFEFWNLDEDTLEDYSECVEKGVEMAIERHHKGFNTATVSFNIILESFKDAQHKLHTLTNNLMQCKKLIGESIIRKGDGSDEAVIEPISHSNTNVATTTATAAAAAANANNTHSTNNNEESKTSETTAKKGEVVDYSISKIEQMKKMWEKSKEYKTKLILHEKEEYFLQVPEILSIYIKNKQFVHAVVLVTDALNLYINDLTEVDQLKHHQQTLLEKKVALSLFCISL